MLRLQLAAVCAGLAYARTETSFEIHVSSNPAAPSDLSGSAAQGTAANPFGSVHAARDAMRAGLGAGKPRTVLISGDHHLSEPLRLDARDAASASSPVVWRSANLRDPARLTGGAKIPGDAFTAAGLPASTADRLGDPFINAKDSGKARRHNAVLACWATAMAEENGCLG